MHKSSFIFAVIPFLFAGGCAVYHPAPLSPDSVEKALKIPAPSIIARQALALQHPILKPIELNPSQPLTPEGAAVLAVLINPSLRAARDRIGVSSAQLITVGILPNPQLTASTDAIIAGQGVTNPFGIGINWDITSLITHDVNVRAAEASLESVRLDVAWSEWQVAETAKAAVYNQLALEAQLRLAKAVNGRLAENLRLIQGAYDRHQRTVVDLSAAQAASARMTATVLALEQQLSHQRLVLKQALGVSGDTPISLRDMELPSRVTLPVPERLERGIQDRRLDLVALRRGYQSQESMVRAAILAQFPKINLGLNYATDNSAVSTLGPAAAVELPIFDHNQGNIARERATRQRLFDEFVDRLFEARSEIAMLLQEIGSLTHQIAAAQQALPSLGKLVEVYRIATEQGNADVLSYYNAWNDLSQKQIDILRLKQQLSDDRISLELAVGEELPQSSTPTTTSTGRTPATQTQPAVNGVKP